ncbi:unnamed protein product [Hermetia illucens]|uniref:C2H2-type domain-containing protein n=1 Tax=Hermetia illucens TaxID=343691 RepID=A0A7R8USQ3_HERIL|nr:unnamed protein product [Hermetia illucens]
MERNAPNQTPETSHMYLSANRMLDAKNSPLALLAQTCSAIGADPPNPKLLANIEKSTKHHKSNAESRDKSSPISQSSSLSSSSSTEAIQHTKSSFKPYEASFRERTSQTPDEQQRSSSAASVTRIKTPKGNQANSSSLNGRCDSNQSATSREQDSPANTQKSSLTAGSLESQQQQQSSQNASPHRASSKDSVGAQQDSSPLSRLSTDPQTSSTKSIPSIVPTTNSSASYFPGYPPGLPYPMDLMTASALMSPHHQMLKAAALSPFLNYARLKGADPATMMQSVCRDPYCTGCSLSPHMMNKTTGQPCPAGCAQCDHATSKSYQAHSPAAAVYAHAQLAALAAASQLPYVCSWIAGDAAYCGKRFATSDELFQHLRTHTASMPESMLSAAAAGLPPTHPLFQRTYPTPPLSPLSTARYHPYSKPSMLPPSLAPPSLAGLPMAPHPSLAQYFSPYSLYGPRLGTPPTMHP